MKERRKTEEKGVDKGRVAGGKQEEKEAQLWNSLSSNVCLVPSLSIFRRRLKTSFIYDCILINLAFIITVLFGVFKLLPFMGYRTVVFIVSL